MMRTLSIALLSAALLSVPAAAQDAAVEYYSDDADVAVEATDEAPAVIEEDAAVVVEDVPAPRYRTRVYGFTAVAPANCGVFKYWNGERCADARDEPPNLD